jgi:TonB family protein
MQRYLVWSSGCHLALVVLWAISGALLTKPRMSYYAVDLTASLPAGSSARGGITPAETREEAPPAPPPPPVPVQERRLPAKEVIQVKGKQKKPPVAPKVQKKRGLNLKAALAALDGQNKGSNGPVSMPGGGGSGIVAEAGPAFPYPWYLKAIADRLDKQWHPPQDFQEDTLCQISFIIHRDGAVSNTAIEKASGDGTFDQLAQRAVLYSNPLPPLPSGFPDETLRVHMKFVGKPQ